MTMIKKNLNLVYLIISIFFLFFTPIGNAQTISSSSQKNQELISSDDFDNEIVPNINIVSPLDDSQLLSQVEDNSNSSVLINPRFSGQFTTGEGVGYESSFGSISGFIPLIQVGGNNLFYVNTNLNIDTEDANLGGNVIFGYREYNPDLDIVFGGYIGTDIRETNNDNTFNQIGIGF